MAYSGYLANAVHLIPMHKRSMHIEAGSRQPYKSSASSCIPSIMWL